MSVADRFNTLLNWISMSTQEENAFETHRQTVAAALKSDFAVNRIEKMGSFSRGSALRGISDLDLLVQVAVDDVRRGGYLVNSGTVLNNVRDRLRARFRATDVGRDQQAVVVAFSGGQEKIDVVPAVFDRMDEGRPVYLIPDGVGGWMRTSPSAHASYINSADARCGGKLKYTIMLLKYWRACRSPAIPLNSFHLELLLAQEGTCAVGKGYNECVRDALALLANRKCRALQDPMGISGNILGANTEPKRATAERSCADSAWHASTALTAEWGRDSPEAYRQWDIVFNGHFPKS